MHWSTTLSVLIAIVGASVVLTPENTLVQFREGTRSFSDPDSKNGSNVGLGLLRMLYLFSFSTCLGVSLWVTFIGGIIMFKNLQRHMFGSLQAKLFPAYFRVETAGAAICLGVFALLHPWSSASTAERLQTGALGLTVTCHLLNLVILEPTTVKVMRERHKIEKEAGIGTEIGLSKNREVAKTNPQLAAINKRFGMAHGMSSLANLLAFGGLGVHLWYLACRVVL
eukprot:TRINITY_DN1110_c0_g1_i1.p1 TRINITY_DN1110_c0_g1~~TRINITY_DN1110_c0_g1_i1.p1  ORF type:complete len:225 (-),score=30.34 TRINITY_DN1110_c0_g1_i1:317-991(-)